MEGNRKALLFLDFTGYLRNFKCAAGQGISAGDAGLCRCGLLCGCTAIVYIHLASTSGSCVPSLLKSAVASGCFYHPHSSPCRIISSTGYTAKSPCRKISFAEPIKPAAPVTKIFMLYSTDYIFQDVYVLHSLLKNLFQPKYASCVPYFVSNSHLQKEYSTSPPKLNILFEDENLRRNMGRNSRILAEKDFSIENVIHRHLEIYSQLSKA